MKASGICPKCKGRKFWRIETVQEHGHGGFAPLPVAVVQSWGGLNRELMGKFETVICAGCGFTEWYAMQLDQLREEPTRGIYFVDNEPKAGLR